jgi:HK97 family phage portal protein
MARWLDNWLNNTLTRLGYVKAKDVAAPPISAVFAGEAPAVVDIWGRLTEEEQERLAITSAWVYSDIKAIANEASRAEIELYQSKDGKNEAVTGHPFQQLLRRPNSHMGRSYLWQYTFWWWLLRGEAYWWLVENGAGELAEIWPIPSTRMAPIPDPAKYISYFAYYPRHGEPPVKIPTRYVCFFRFPNPFDFHRGLSPLSAYRLAVEADQSAATWNRDTFTHEVTLRTLLSLPQDISKPNFEVLRQEIVGELEEHRKRFLVVRAGDLKAETLGLSHKDMEFLAGREFTRKEIDRVFGIPEGFWSEKANRANAEAARASFIEFAVWPLLKMMAEEITAQAVMPRYGPELLAEFEDIRPRDRDLLIRERRQYWEVQSLNAARAELGLAEYDGPLAEVIGGLPVPLATNSQFVLSLAGIAPTGGPGGGVLPGGGPEGKGLSPAAREDLRRWKSIALRRRRGGEDPAGYEFESEHLPGEMATAIKAALARATTEEGVRAAFTLPDNAGTTKSLTREDAETALTGGLSDVLGRWLGRVARLVHQGEKEPLTDDFGRELDAVIQRSLVQQVAQRAMEAAEALGVDFDPALINEGALAWARSYGYDLVRGLNETTRAGVSRAIEQFVANPGLTVDDIAAMLEPTFGPVRAESIAVTEITRAYSQAENLSQQMLRDMGLETVRIWNTARDEIAQECPICWPLDQKTEDEWGEYSDGPPAHPRCRCWPSQRIVRK